MWKAFPSPLMLHGYCDINMICCGNHCDWIFWPNCPALVWFSSRKSFVFSLRSLLAQGARLLAMCLVWTVQHLQLRAQSAWTQRSRRWWNSNPRPSPTSHQSPSAPCPRRPPSDSPCPPRRSVYQLHPPLFHLLVVFKPVCVFAFPCLSTSFLVDVRVLKKSFIKIWSLDVAHTGQ